MSLFCKKPVSTFFDVKAGLRYDSPEGPDRAYGVLGVVGLAPQWFEIDANFYLSEKGDVSLGFDAEYELLLTNKLILTSSLDISAAFTEDEEISVGKGLNSSELRIRISYDLIDRAFSPYVGVVYERKYGDTADIAREDDERAEDWLFVIGAGLIF